MTCKPRLYTTFGVECATCGKRAPVVPIRADAIAAWEAMPCERDRKPEPVALPATPAGPVLDLSPEAFWANANQVSPGMGNLMRAIERVAALPSEDAAPDRDPGNAAAGIPAGADASTPAQEPAPAGDAPVPSVWRTRGDRSADGSGSRRRKVDGRGADDDLHPVSGEG